MGFPFEYSRIFMLALIGGWIGVLFMIPLRRQLIVQEHGNLLYPEGTACADVLVAGEKGGSFASRVFWGLGLGGAYTFLMATAQVWKQRPLYEPAWLPGASFRAEITSEYLGVGYIIGPKIAGTIFAGGVFSWLVLMPAIKFFGEGLAEPLYPSTIPVRAMTPGQTVGKLHPPDGCRRRRHGRPDHADEDHADDRQRAQERHEGHPRAAGRRGGGQAGSSVTSP